MKLLYHLTSSPSVYLYYYLPAVRHSVTCRLHIGLFLIKQITDFTYWIRIVSHSFTVQSVQLIWATYFTNTMHSKTFMFTELFKNKMKKINWNEDLVCVMSLPAPPCVCECVFSGTWRYFWKCIILTFILWRKKLFSCEWDVFGRFGHCWNMRKSS